MRALDQPNWLTRAEADFGVVVATNYGRSSYNGGPT